MPKPSVMPVDREKWLAELHLSNFVNAYYQYRDLHRLQGLKRLLIVGPGQGLATEILRWRGYEVTTFDIDEGFHPDVIGSVHDMSVFNEKEFDAVVASHVLEHLPEAYLDSAMAEIARVGRYALIYLPVHGAHFQMRLRSNLRDSDLSLVVDVPRHLERPDGITPRYMGGQHYWEVGLKGFKKVDIVRRMSKFFDVIDCYRNRDWLPSQNFVLRARRFESS
jgi:SAM-dependent methyltransferase